MEMSQPLQPPQPPDPPEGALTWWSRNGWWGIPAAGCGCIFLATFFVLVVVYALVYFSFDTFSGV